jgi:hypothetical protein
MINPDGVANGHFRDNCLGQNLNRFYKSPCSQKQPEIFHLDQLLKNICEDNQSIELYMDLHGHLNSGGIFIYGNFFKDIQVSIFY